ncbi:MAG: FAD-dependent oxidoreductase [Kiritimatiellales bacterium]
MSIQASIHEVFRTKISGEYDVIVGGAGPAGVAAAVSAARAGARVLLIEANGCLGGIWTAGLLSWVIDADKPGIMKEIRNDLEKMGALGEKRRSARNWTYDPEIMKLLLERMCVASRVNFQLHTRIVSVNKCTSRFLNAVITESRSGREAWRAQHFIDCTGDGDLAFHAGCSFSTGHPGTNDIQPASMTMLVTGVQFAEIERFVGGGMQEPKARLSQLIWDLGIDISNKSPVLFPIYDDLFAFIPNHQYNVFPGDAAALTQATVEAREECHAIVKALQKQGGIWEKLRIVATTEHLGMREGRRIHGIYTVNLNDMIYGVHHADAVCRVTMNIDVHNTQKDSYSLSKKNTSSILPYDIPLRALIARDADNLWLAGRCISGDFFSHSSYRVTGNAVATGEAAGRAAALTVLSGKMTSHINNYQTCKINE